MTDFKMTDHQKGLFDKLTRFQKRMALNDIVGMKPAENHKEAGGVCKNEANRAKLASEILNKPDVLAFLESMKEAAVSSAVISRQEMLEELSIIARTNNNDLIEWGYRDVEVVGEDGEKTIVKQSFWTLRPMEDINPDHMKAIEEVSVGKDGLKFKRTAKLAAYKQIAELAGYNAAQKHDHNVKAVSMEISENTSPQDAADIYKSLLGE